MRPRSGSVIGNLVRLREDVWLARIELALHAPDDPVARADGMPAFRRVDPAVVVHRGVAVGAPEPLGDLTVPELAHKDRVVTRADLAGARIDRWVPVVVDLRVIAVVLPDGRLDDDGLLAVLAGLSGHRSVPSIHARMRATTRLWGIQYG